MLLLFFEDLAHKADTEPAPDPSVSGSQKLCRKLLK